jgi:hypothetical protein
LLAPEVDDVKVVVGIDAGDNVNGPISALALFGIVRSAVLRQMLRRLVIPAEPLPL